MKTKNVIVILIGMASFFSCADRGGAEFEVFLEGQLVKTDVNKGKWPRWMYGDDLYALDHDYNLWRGKLTKSEWQEAEKVFVHGHGQNEFGDMIISQDVDGTLYVLDHPIKDNMASLSMTSLTKIQQTDNMASIKNPKNWEKYDLTEMSFWLCGDRFVVLSDSTILTVGTPENDQHHIISVINYKNQTVTPLDYWPNDSTPEALDDEKLMVYTHGSGIERNGKDRLLYWDDSGKLAFIFTIDGAKTNILNHIYDDFLPIPGIAKTPSRERIHCCADNDRIYVLYKNLTSKGEKMVQYDRKEPFPFGNVVEVYDWDGIKQQIIHLDQLGQEIMLSKDGTNLYLYSGYLQDGSDPYIYSYDLGDDCVQMSKNTKDSQKESKQEAVDSLHVLEVGDKYVDAELFDMQGNTHRLFEAFGDGRYVLLDFWNLGCGACRQSESELLEVYKRMNGALEIVGINLDSIPRWQNHEWSKHIVWKNWNDGKGYKGGIKSHYYDWNAAPFYVLLSPDGRILWEMAGYGAGDFLGIAEALNGPKQDNYSSPQLAVRRVDANGRNTKVSFRIYCKKGLWFNIAKESYLEANGKKYKLTEADGIKLGENNIPQEKAYTVRVKYGLDINYCDFTLTFEPFDTVPESFDFKAGDSEDAFFIRNISLK